VPGPVGGPSREVPVGILHLLDRLDDAPAFVLDAKYDVLAWNHMAVALLGDFAAIPEPDRNLVWQVFCGPRRVDLHPGPDADVFAEECVAALHAASAKYPDDPGIRHLLARLRANSPEFIRRWERQWVCVSSSTTKRLHHPVVGELELDCQLLDIADRGQRLVIYTAAPGSRSADSLRLLDVVGTQWPAH
jgi:MmyB-like transcription regulator ligand binding domain